MRLYHLRVSFLTEDIDLEDDLKIFNDIFGNYMLVSAGLGWLGAQIIKIFTGMFKERKFSLSYLLFSTGGMPSSHSAVVCALTTASILQNGWVSELTAVCIILSLVVMIDASGVRYETGKQAQILNKITKEIFSGDPELANSGLKELVGHTPFQVFIGALYGVLIAILMSFLML